MADTSKIDFQELRKLYPRMGKKWDMEEDARLKSAYQQWQALESGDFDTFLNQLVQDFGRASGGLKARLAMHFTDVPGWDYKQAEEREIWRKDARSREAEVVVEQFGAGATAQLLEEYKKYVTAKRETLRQFVLRMSHRFEQSRATINAVLAHKANPLVEYKQEDLDVPTRRRRVEEDLTHISFTGNTEAVEALRVMNETSQHLFLTGEAGTGKSTLLQYFRSTTKKNVVVLAPTGVAALNVQGQTIHSFCAFGPDITLAKVKRLGSWAPKKKLLVKVDTIVIDEISMVRADLLDCVDKFLQLNSPRGHMPFGGFQMVFIGDMFQLPPVEKDFIQQNPSVLAKTGTPSLSREGERPGLFSPPKERSTPLLSPSGGDVSLRDREGMQGGVPREAGGGDYQSPYFFDSHVFIQTEFTHIQLQTMYRQQDQVFIDVLNAVRNNAVTAAHLQILNGRSLADSQEKFTFEQFAIYLTPTNARARQVNNYFLERIHSPLKTYSGRASGTFEDRELPTDLQLQVKVGSQVMMLNNDQKKRWVNGTMGKIVGIQKDDSNDHPNFSPPFQGGVPRVAGGGGERPMSIAEPESISYEFTDEAALPDEDNDPTSTADAIIIELETGETVYVEPHTWEMFKFVLDKETQSIDSESTGSFTQYPFKLAWAVTIHKAQGKTFSQVYIDLSTGTFAHGQLYVALSRCRTLEGIHLRRPITQSDIILDPRVVKFIKSLS